LLLRKYDDFLLIIVVGHQIVLWICRRKWDFLNFVDQMNQGIVWWDLWVLVRNQSWVFHHQIVVFYS